MTDVAASSSASAAAAAASSSAAAPAQSVEFVRENRFYYKPPQEFVDDLLNAAGDYIGYGCDEYEKALNSQVVKKATRRAELGQAVDAMYQQIDGRLRNLTPNFESQILSLLRIPSNVVVSSEFQSGELGLSGDQQKSAQEQEQKLETDLAALQQRVANAALLNRALRNELASLESDEKVYVEHEHQFPREKKYAAQEAQQLAQVQDVASSVASLRPVHDAVTSQFIDVFGLDSAKDLSNTTSIAAGGVTQQINMAARLGDNTATIAPAAAAAASSVSNMNISEDAANQLF